MTYQDRLSPGRYKLRIEDYLVLDAAGAFHDARTELLDGEIIVLSPQYRPHLRVKSELAFRIRLALERIGSPLQVATEGSVAVSDHDMPLPDVIVTSELRGEGPVPVKSISLLVEVSSTSLETDLGPKAMSYAMAGVPEYWVADVNGRVIHQKWASAGGGYAERREVAFGEAIAAATIEGLGISTDGL